MTEIEQRIRQLEAKAEYLTLMIEAQRAKPSELIEVTQELEKAKGMVAREKANELIPAKEVTKKTIEIPTNQPAKAQKIDDENVTSVFFRKGELMENILSKQKAQRALSNKLHTIPTHVDCPELTEATTNLAKEIEELWTEYRFIERNGKLPSEEISDRQADKEVEFRLLEIANELRSLRDTRLKLEKKIESPHLYSKSPKTKLQEWQIELIEVKSKINDLIFEKEQLKS